MQSETLFQVPSDYIKKIVYVSWLLKVYLREWGVQYVVTKLKVIAHDSQMTTLKTHTVWHNIWNINTIILIP